MAPLGPPPPLSFRGQNRSRPCRHNWGRTPRLSVSGLSRPEITSDSIAFPAPPTFSTDVTGRPPCVSMCAREPSSFDSDSGSFSLGRPSPCATRFNQLESEKYYRAYMAGDRCCGLCSSSVSLFFSERARERERERASLWETDGGKESEFFL